MQSLYITHTDGTDGTDGDLCVGVGVLRQSLLHSSFQDIRTLVLLKRCLLCMRMCRCVCAMDIHVYL
jgi:hypothetical protein